MKKLLLLGCLTLLVFQTSFAQKRYDRWWDQVETYEIDGKSKSALEKVNFIYKKAKLQNKDQQFVKAFLYKAKYELILKKDIRQDVYQNFKDEIAAQKTPVKQILSSVLAESLSKYYSRNRYKIRKRSATSKDSLNTDFESWNAQAFSKHSIQLYQNSLQDPDKLLQLQDEDYTKILTYGENYKKYQTSLYDLLARRYLSFLNDYRNGGGYNPSNQNPFFIRDETYFSSSKQFINFKISPESKIPSKNYLRIKLFQKLEKIHLKDKYKLTLLTFQLQRLKFIRKEALIENKSKHYLEALQNLKNQYSTKKELALISYNLAEFYHQNADKKKHPDYQIKSLEEAQKTVELAPKQPVAIEAQRLIKIIEAVHINVTTQDFGVPKTPNKALVSFRNADSLYAFIYKNPSVSAWRKKHESDSLAEKYFELHKPFLTKIYVLPKRKGYFNHSTEIILPTFEKGNYAFLFSYQKNPDFTEYSSGFHLTQFTNLAYTRHNYGKKTAFFIADRKTGKPINNAEVEIRQVAGKPGKTVRGQSNKNGLVNLVPKDDARGEREGFIAKDGDTLQLFSFRFRRYSNRSKNDETTIEFNSQLLTDRGIYRPGQPLYFKGFLTFQKNEERKVAENANVKVVLFNPNDDPVEMKDFSSNEFGSFHGEFKPPKSGLNGEYYIKIVPDFKANSKWKKYTDDFDNDRTYFNVEDYKRPTFEVKFNDLKKTYILGDSVKLSGNAKAFFGGNLSNSEVQFTVDRNLRHNWLFRSSDVYLPIRQTRLKSGKVKTDDQGRFEITFRALPDSSVTKKFKPVFQFYVKADVTDINGETRSVEKTVNVGYHATIVSFVTSPQIEIGENQDLKLSVVDLNGHKTKVEGGLKIFRYKKPDRVFKDRPWGIPEIQQIPEKKFRKLFPYQKYDSLDIEKNWPKKVVKTIQIHKTDSLTFNYDKIADFSSGKYLLQFKGKGLRDFSVETEQNIQVTNPESKPEKQTGFLTFNYSVKKPKARNKNVQLEFFTPLENLDLFLEIAYNGDLQKQEMLTLEKGKNTKEIHLPANAKNVFVQYTYVKENVAKSAKRRITLPQPEEKKLQIEVKTFRDKLAPGKKETWELKVLNNDKKPADAEVLASMYDESLDEFKPFQWNLSLYQKPYNNIYSYNSGISRVRLPDFGNKQLSRDNFNFSHYRFNYQPTFTDLKTFGYDFVRPTYTNGKYLKILQFEHEAKEQSGKIGSGHVSDGDGLPLPDVNIVVAGTNHGTQTDFDGNYYIKVHMGDMLQFSYVGFENKQVKATSKPMNVIMDENANTLNSVTISTGYKTTTKRRSTKAVTTITAENMSSPNAPAIQKLKGEVAGLNIAGNRGQPGSSDTIILRGAATANGNKEPLFIIDGVPMKESEFKKLNANDIMNVNVLKGPAATSVYGNRGANGVVVITTKKGMEALEKIKPRKNLQETAFFFPDLKTDKNGNVSFSFDSPEALTRWKFQAFAHNKNLQQAYLQLNTVTQKDLNIIPNFPRFFRSGDTVMISAKINNLSKKGVVGIAKLQFTDEIAQKSVQLITDKTTIKNFQLKSKGNAEVHWKVVIPEELSAVRYKITAKAGNFTDGETNVIPVLSNRIFVTESLPIWVNPGEEKSFTLENLKDNHSKSLQNHRLIFDYTSNPAWTALRALPYLIEFPHECSEQIFARYYANTLSQKILMSNPKIAELVKNWQKSDTLKTELEKNQDLKNILLEESPWLKTAKSQKAQQKRLADLLNKKETTKKAKAALLKLKQLQLPSGGFPWFNGGDANTAISIHILTGLGRLGKPKSDAILQQNYAQITKKLVEFLDEEYLKKHKNNDGKEVYTFGSGGLHYLYARSFFTQKNEKLNAYKTKALEHFKTDWLELRLQEKIVLALVADYSDETDFAKKILVSLKENAVINSDAGMYWKENTSGFGWHQDPIETQALAIEAFAEIGNDQETINSLKTWLLKQKQTQAWKSTKATTDAIYALLLKGDDLLSENPSPKITIGGEKLAFDSAEGRAGYLKKEFKPKEISPKKATVQVKNDSKTAQFGGLYWQYFENSDQVKQSNLAELQMKKELFVNEESSDGKTLVPIADRKLKVGDLLTVRLTIKAKTNFEFMHLKDMRAAGLEPVDVISKYHYQDGLGYYQSTKDVATHFFFDRLPKGTYVFEYELRINNPGEFSNGITRLQSVYAPEFSVQSRGKRVEFEGK